MGRERFQNLVSINSSVRRAERAGEKVERTTGFEALARAGFVARGVIYGVIGILAVKLAIGAKAARLKAANSRGSRSFVWPAVPNCGERHRSRSKKALPIGIDLMGHLSTSAI